MRHSLARAILVCFIVAVAAIGSFGISLDDGYAGYRLDTMDSCWDLGCCH
jgi:hypothetical protein